MKGFFFYTLTTKEGLEIKPVIWFDFKLVISHFTFILTTFPEQAQRLNTITSDLVPKVATMTKYNPLSINKSAVTGKRLIE